MKIRRILFSFLALGMTLFFLIAESNVLYGSEDLKNSFNLELEKEAKSFDELDRSNENESILLLTTSS